MAIDRWNDDRLDDLSRRVRSVEDVQVTVAVVKTKLDTLEVGQARTQSAIEKLDTKLDQVVDEPLVRGRDFRKQLTLGVAAAFSGAVFVLIATLVAGVLK